jgi:hypothetical protein
MLINPLPKKECVKDLNAGFDNALVHEVHRRLTLDLGFYRKCDTRKASQLLPILMNDTSILLPIYSRSRRLKSQNLEILISKNPEISYSIICMLRFACIRCAISEPLRIRTYSHAFQRQTSHYVDCPMLCLWLAGNSTAVFGLVEVS